MFDSSGHMNHYGGTNASRGIKMRLLGLGWIDSMCDGITDHAEYALIYSFSHVSRSNTYLLTLFQQFLMPEQGFEVRTDNYHQKKKV